MGTGKSLSRRAQDFVQRICPVEIRIERIYVGSTYHFGVHMRCPLDDAKAFLRSLAGYGLVANINRTERVPGKGKPVEYYVDLQISIPTDWQEP